MNRHRRVFVSYAHESPAHVEAVRQLWALLRADGVDARLDLPATGSRRDWVIWMLDQLRDANFVIVVASRSYRRRADGEARADEGRGVQFEGAVLRDLYYADRPAWQERVLPVILPGESADGLPRWLGPAAGTTYPVTDLSAEGIRGLLRVITGQPEYTEPPLGPVPMLPPRDSPPAGSEPEDRRLEELGRVVDAFGRIDEFVSQAGRYQIIALLPPEMRGAINDAPNARLHILAVVRGCAQFGETGRQELLAVLRLALPVGRPAVQDAIRLLETVRLFRDERAYRRNW